VVDNEQDVERHFSLDNLRQLFEFKENTICDTHDAFKCKRCVDGKQITKPVSGVVNTGATGADTSTWNHFSHQELHQVYDHILREQSEITQVVTFCFQNKSHDDSIKQ
jgi:DNA repair and recombination RAD54-like protein